VYSVFLLAAFAFLKEIARGVIPTAWNVLDYELNSMTDFVFDRLGL